VSSPLNARLDENGHRYYIWTARGIVERFWSVTVLIDSGVPKYLVPWASKIIAELVIAAMSVNPRRWCRSIVREWAIAGREQFDQIQADGGLVSFTPAKVKKMTPADFALRWLKGAPDRIRDAAAARGSKVHELAEEAVKALAIEATQLVIDGVNRQTILARCTDETRPYVSSFLDFVRDHQPVFLMAEGTVYNRSAGYAGTLDAGFILPKVWPDEPVLGDYKTGNQVYAEVGMQLAAYSRGEFVGMPDGTEAPMPAFKRAVCLHLTPTGYELRPVRIDDQIYLAFLHSCEVARFRLEMASTVIGDPILLEKAA
jgi:hypothetical protein